ncbi:uncharacterized protein HaLaN_06583 [Haematococcus lacustris]|uniref:Uncharacterized protein n=1 Tax=Haematococcus lacustris TaxID=44745 RepID=A0A699YLH9_HAELA|nr:uncharacterized protein HaLaN_06583 [Haematococcus lacustris]
MSNDFASHMVWLLAGAAELSEELNQGMFADMRYATLHIPWALLQRDDFGACTEARKAFNEFNEHVQADRNKQFCT